MPKRKPAKKPATRPRKRKKQSSSKLWMFIVAGLISTAIIWFILSYKPSAKLPSTQTETSDIAQKQDKAAKDKKAKSTADTPDTDAARKTPDLEPTIIAALKELDIHDNIYKLQKKGNTVTFKVPLDDNVYDLNFANMILKGRVEKAGGRFVSAKESRKTQTLEFAHDKSDTKWKVELYYDAKPYAQKAPTKTLAIVVDDFGEIGGNLLSGFLDLPTSVTFAIMPEYKHSVNTMQKAHEQGRESIIHVPMEPIGYPQTNPGKNAILVQMKEAEISKLLNKLIDGLPLCIGINNHMGSLATADTDVMTSVMKVLKARNKLFLDSRTSNVSVAYQMAQQAHIPAFRNSIFLDSPDISEATMNKKLRELESLSQRNPHLIAITHCHNQDKLNYLKRFIQRAQQAGFTLVPLSQSGKYSVPAIL